MAGAARSSLAVPICHCIDIAKSLQNRGQRHAEPVRHLPEPEILPTYLFGQFDRGIYDPVTEIERRLSTPFFAMEPSCNKRPLRRI
jgi:hypothetical protein